MVTNYNYNIARHLTLVHGRADPIPSHEYREWKLTREKDFISLITSPHVLQDVPFGESLFKLSNGEVIKTPNVMMIPEHIVQQFQKYAVKEVLSPWAGEDSIEFWMNVQRLLRSLYKDSTTFKPKEPRHLITWTNWSINWLTVVKVWVREKRARAALIEAIPKEWLQGNLFRYTMSSSVRDLAEGIHENGTNIIHSKSCKLL